jgi:uncharacterized protein
MSSMIETLRAALEGMPAVQLAVVFGSHSRGTARQRSDIDLGLIVEKDSIDIQVLGVTLERLLGRTLHVVLLDEAPPLLRFEIGRDGTLLLERRPYAWADFRARSMIDWWDWAPTAAMVQRTVAARLREEARDGAP